MTEAYEALKGYTDIPMALVALVLGFLALKTGKKRGWAEFFFLVFGVAALGVAAHACSMPEALWRATWVALFVMMFELVFRFTDLFSAYVCSEPGFRVRLFRILQIIICLVAVISVAAFGRKEMLFFLAYAACCLVFLVRCFVRTRRVPAKAIVLVALFPVLILMQAFNAHIPYAVVIEHIVITVMLFVIYSIAAADSR